MKKIAIILEGGIVQNVLSEEDLEVTVVDYDVEGADENELISIFGEDAYVSSYLSEVNPEEIQKIDHFCLQQSQEQ